MHVQTLQMDPRIAKIHYTDYRRKVREHRKQRLEAAEKKITEGGKMFRTGRAERSQIEKEDEMLMLSYREMAKGQRILNLAQVFREFGLDSDSKSCMPVLAVAQADWPHVYVIADHQYPVIFYKSPWARERWHAGQRHYVDGALVFDPGIFPAELRNGEWRKQQNLPSLRSRGALVPAIPAHLRPAGDLSQYHILFEAKWTHDAPPDPLLLKHVGGYVYSVIAQWDLTDVEKMVLEGRAPAR